MSSVSAVEVLTQGAQGTHAASSQFAAMETLDKRINFSSRIPPHEMGASVARSHAYLPMDAETEDILNKISHLLTGHPSLARRLLEIRRRFGIAEQLIGNNQARERAEQRRVEEIVTQIQSTKGWQATAIAFANFGGGIMGILGALLPPEIGKILTAASRFAPGIGDTIRTSLDGGLVPLEFEKNLFSTQFQTRHQSTEGLKRILSHLLEQLQQVAQSENRATGAVFR
ncbi:MAG: hypothetical protein KR126chlam1_00387 [Chlamydiae bacterium]|nr:hypothetical protein [Chlamydiota bacterium]